VSYRFVSLTDYEDEFQIVEWAQNSNGVPCCTGATSDVPGRKTIGSRIVMHHHDSKSRPILV